MVPPSLSRIIVNGRVLHNQGPIPDAQALHAIETELRAALGTPEQARDNDAQPPLDLPTEDDMEQMFNEQGGAR